MTQEMNVSGSVQSNVLQIFDAGDRVVTRDGEHGTIMHGGPYNYKVQIDNGGRLWFEVADLQSEPAYERYGWYDNYN